MTTRLEMHEILRDACGSNNVYFQPPESIKMKYPAVVYSINNIDNIFADDSGYIQTNVYSITVIDEDPDSEIVDRISKLPKCKFNRRYNSENLNHTTFTIY